MAPILPWRKFLFLLSGCVLLSSEGGRQHSGFHHVHVRVRDDGIGSPCVLILQLPGVLHGQDGGTPGLASEPEQATWSTHIILFTRSCHANCPAMEGYPSTMFVPFFCVDSPGTGMTESPLVAATTGRGGRRPPSYRKLVAWQRHVGGLHRTTVRADMIWGLCSGDNMEQRQATVDR